MQLLDEVQATHWFWDTEVMVRAHKHGFKIKEIPVEWKSGKGTKVNIFKDSWNMFWQIMGLWWNLENKEKIVNRVANITNALASKANPKMKIIPAQKTNHSARYRHLYQVSNC